MEQERILSGIRATSKLHIGNYLGALKQFVEIQNSGHAECFFFIADLHALTTPFVPAELRKNTFEVAAEYVAAGLNPDKSVIFLQNQVHEHSELAWIFECITPLGELERMTQFKDKAGIFSIFQKKIPELSGNKLEELRPLIEKVKSSRIITSAVLEEMRKITHLTVKAIMEIYQAEDTARSEAKLGLLAYPTLMAADILLYKPSKVPVGEDQSQHIEISRTIARKFNTQFGETFPEPKNYSLKPLRVMSLKNPNKKMSKTADTPLYLDDSPEEVHSKIKKAVTATEGNGESDGAENLLYLLSHFGTQAHIQQLSDARRDGSIKYSELKAVLAEDISEYFKTFRERKKELLSRPDTLAQILGDGAHKARKVAQQTLAEVKDRIGLL
jgi:tryptophanyl-tRNA synthetase